MKKVVKRAERVLVAAKRSGEAKARMDKKRGVAKASKKLREKYKGKHDLKTIAGRKAHAQEKGLTSRKKK